MTEQPNPNPATDLDGFLSSRYPTFVAVVKDLRNATTEARLPRWIDCVRRSSAEVAAEPKTSKKREAVDAVVRGFEVAGSLALQFALKPS